MHIHTYISTSLPAHTGHHIYIYGTTELRLLSAATNPPTLNSAQPRLPAMTPTNVYSPVVDVPPVPPKRRKGVQRGLEARHIQMIAIGGTIGTGLFVGSGATIAIAGPVGALVAFLIVGTMVFFTTSSLGEMATLFPVSGSFVTYAGRFVDPAYSFTLGWNYWAQWAVSLPSELSALGIIVSFWTPNVPTWIWSASILTVLVAVNLVSVKSFGEAEYWLAAVKVVAVIAFIFVGVAVDLGWLGSNPAVGLEYWSIPGAPFKNGVLGVFNVFVIAFFSFGGTELIGITAGEAKNPRKNVPKAINQTFWRILIFYILSILTIGLLIRNDDPTLLDSSTPSDISIAPFTRVFQSAGLNSAAHAMNAVIFTAVLSAGNTAIYAASRTLMTMAREGRAPAWLGVVNARGVPVASLAVTTAVGCLCFLGTVFGDGTLFTTLLHLTGLSSILTWLSITLIHLRFRAAWTAQNRSLDDLPYRAPFFPYGQYLSLALGAAVIVGMGWAALDEGGSRTPALHPPLPRAQVPQQHEPDPAARMRSRHESVAPV
ncbi:amino acid permease-domain-containing protein [Fimicolochytrium jonesii]|uniref:amino acid permease-domain-containing protein n=1 Tax=Fimicolochytrium jonesii TaxID=1396493 RepID=UPI0022FE9881|nr:amino acid permease-domain-containing protein [Fimicolochytrium jonesii]KAI8825597.1 amino acid permease-domain-containing protein [Fimicolochytrium jonesii]